MWCFRVHPAGPGIAKSLTEFQARCKIVAVFQERIAFPGSWQVRNREGASPFLMGPACMDQSHLAHLSCCYPDVSQSSQHACIALQSLFLHGSNLKTNLRNVLRFGLSPFCLKHLTQTFSIPCMNKEMNWFKNS